MFSGYLILGGPVAARGGPRDDARCRGLLKPSERIRGAPEKPRKAVRPPGWLSAARRSPFSSVARMRIVSPAHGSSAGGWAVYDDRSDRRGVGGAARPPLRRLPRGGDGRSRRV